MTVSATPRSRRAAAARANGFGFDFPSSFTDVFDDLFGEFMGGEARPRQNRGGDLRYNLEISLEDAFHGKTAQIRVNTAVACEACGGTGAEAGSKPEQCSTCTGAGKVRAQQGFFTIERTCPQCHGSGRIIRNPVQSLPRAPATCRRSARFRSIPGGRRGRHAHPPDRRRPGRASMAARRAISTSSCHLRRTAFSSATAQIFIAAPDLVRDGRARRHDRSADLRRRPRQDHDPRRHPSRPPVPAARQGHAGDARRRHERRPLYRGFGGNAGQAQQEAKELLRAFEKESEDGTHPESEGFFAKVKEFWSRAGEA